MRSSRGSTLIQPAVNQPRPQAKVEIAGSHWNPLTGIRRCRLLPLRDAKAGSTPRLQRGNFMPFSGEAFSRNLSLWAARARSHVFDQSQMLNYGYNQITDRNKCQALVFSLLQKRKAPQIVRDAIFVSYTCHIFDDFQMTFYKAEEAWPTQAFSCSGSKP